MNISRLYHTLRHLQFSQWYYRAWYKVKKNLYSPPQNVTDVVTEAADFGHKPFFQNETYSCYRPADHTFNFLNIEHSFKDGIDWNYAAYGKLWTYNLNYFEWLNDERIAVEQRLSTIHNYIAKEALLKDGLEPYPISLRGMQWIKFLNRHGLGNDAINATLYRHYHRLAAFPEYHIQANHLLENGFSLFFAGHYFNEESFYNTGKDILTAQLKEQVLPDGAHYELSPMYHCIILQRLMECIEMARFSGRFSNEMLLSMMEATAGKMLGWLQAFIFKDGTYAMMGDATEGIAPGPAGLLSYATHLHIAPVSTQLSESGYRKVSFDKYEMLADVGSIIPSYQPGHAHADTFTWCLNVDGKPVIVDTGISTYEKNERRQYERGTAAHNTIVIDDTNSSDVWSGFRVGKRAGVDIIKDEQYELSASHSGYRNVGIIHKRTFNFNAHKILVDDRLEGYQGQKAVSCIHFHPSCRVEQTGPGTFKSGGITINIAGTTGATLVNYLYCNGYNKTESAVMIQAHVEEHVVVTIEL